MEETKEKKTPHLEVISPEKVEEIINKISQDTPVNNDIAEEGVDLEVVKGVLKALSGQTTGTALTALTSAALLLPTHMLVMMASILSAMSKSMLQQEFLDMFLRDTKGK